MNDPRPPDGAPAPAVRAVRAWLCAGVLLIAGCGAGSSESGAPVDQPSAPSLETSSEATTEPSSEPTSEPTSTDSAYLQPCSETIEGVRSALGSITDGKSGKISADNGSIAGMLDLHVELGAVATALDPAVTPEDLAAVAIPLLTVVGATDYDGSGFVDMLAVTKVQPALDAVLEVCANHGAAQ